MKETLLLFNVTDPAQLAALRKALLVLKMKVRKIEKKDYNEAIGYLVQDGITPSNGEAYTGGELPGEMLLMAGLSSARIDMLLATFRKYGVRPIDCKAVLTPDNRTWSAVKLYEELHKEHKLMHGIEE